MLPGSATENHPSKTFFWYIILYVFAYLLSPVSDGDYHVLGGGETWISTRSFHLHLELSVVYMVPGTVGGEHMKSFYFGLRSQNDARN